MKRLFKIQWFSFSLQFSNGIHMLSLKCLLNNSGLWGSSTGPVIRDGDHCSDMVFNRICTKVNNLIIIIINLSLLLVCISCYKTIKSKSPYKFVIKMIYILAVRNEPYDSNSYCWLFLNLFVLTSISASI